MTFEDEVVVELDDAAVSLEEEDVAELDGVTFALDDVVAELDEAAVSLEDEDSAELETFELEASELEDSCTELDEAAVSLEDEDSAELETFELEASELEDSCTELEESSASLDKTASESLEGSFDASRASLALSEHPARKATVKAIVAGSPCRNLFFMIFPLLFSSNIPKKESGWS